MPKNKLSIDQEIAKLLKEYTEESAEDISSKLDAFLEKIDDNWESTPEKGLTDCHSSHSSHSNHSNSGGSGWC